MPLSFLRRLGRARLLVIVCVLDRLDVRLALLQHVFQRVELPNHLFNTFRTVVAARV
jgi:hypothetical protein